jgi:hypothetical protein
MEVVLDVQWIVTGVQWRWSWDCPMEVKLRCPMAAMLGYPVEVML